MDKLSPSMPKEYSSWLAALKTQIHSAQSRAALAVNRDRIVQQAVGQLPWEHNLLLVTGLNE